MLAPTALPGGVVLRPLVVSDAPALLDAYLRNRTFLQPFEPVRPDSFWTVTGQQERVEQMMQAQLDGRQLSCALFRDERLIGTATLNTIVLGAFHNADLGYWVDGQEIGQGLASAAVSALCRIADAEIGLHRIAASTNPDNLASQRVLAKNGFVQYGAAADYLYLNGRWHGSHLFQRILNDRPAGEPVSSGRWREVHP